MINSSITILDLSNFSRFFFTIFSHCNIISYKLGYLLLISLISVFIFLKITNFNLHDLVNLSIYLASSIFKNFACFGLIKIPLVFFYGRVGKILDTAAKLLVIIAGSSNIYKNHIGGSDQMMIKTKIKQLKITKKMKLKNK